MSSATLRTQRSDYNPASILYNSQRFKGFSPSHVQAGTRALLRYQTFNDGADDTYHTSGCSMGGLHPLYFTFNNPAGSTEDPCARSQLLKDTLTDIFDAVSEILQVGQNTN